MARCRKECRIRNRCMFSSTRRRLLLPDRIEIIDCDFNVRNDPPYFLYRLHENGISMADEKHIRPISFCGPDQTGIRGNNPKFPRTEPCRCAGYIPVAKLIDLMAVAYKSVGKLSVGIVERAPIMFLIEISDIQYPHLRPRTPC